MQAPRLTTPSPRSRLAMQVSDREHDQFISAQFDDQLIREVSHRTATDRTPTAVVIQKRECCGISPHSLSSLSDCIGQTIIQTYLLFPIPLQGDQ